MTSSVRSANGAVRVACVGIRGRGRAHIAELAKVPNVEIAALCDVDGQVLRQRVADVEKMGRNRPAAFIDFRKLLEDKSIDAVTIATQNHWHTLQTIWACQAGKDVYVEKPCSYNVFEARQIVAATKKYDRIVQHGTQSRSSEALRDGFRQMREGLLGDVYMGRALCYKWRDTIGKAKEETVPSGVDYNLWTGPAPMRPFTKNRFHYTWHWFWDYGNGDIGNQGIHQMDVARWGLGVTYPTKVSAMGGRYMFDDDQETPNTLVAKFEFDGAGKKKLLVFEVRHWISNHEAGIGGEKPGNTIGNLFYGSKGYMAVGGGYKTFMGKEQAPGPTGSGRGESHMENFINAVRSRKTSDLRAPIEEGAISTVLVHLANISYRLARTVRFDENSMTCPGDPEATRMFTRNYRAPFIVPANV